MRVKRPQLVMYPAQIKQAIDLPDQMIGWNDLVEIKRIEKLSLSILPPPHHALLPADALSTNGITDLESSQREFCNMG